MKQEIIIGIDATNLNLGGGATHIINILDCFDPENHNIDKIIIWGRSTLLNQLNDYPWLEKRTNDSLNGNLIQRYQWLLFKSKSEFEKKKCDILFAPGGLYFGKFRPFVSMSRNMLLFDKKERNRLGFRLRMKILFSRFLQIKSFKRSSAIIFISDYAQSVILNELNIKNQHIKINHGISDKFRNKPNIDYDFKYKYQIRLLYVSHIYEYKHPWNIVKAAAFLRSRGYNVKLDIVGGGDAGAINRLEKTISGYDQQSMHFKYHGKQPYTSIQNFYKDADIFVYASTCENMPNILIEAMSAGVPIASSKTKPMPEFLKDAGLYFDAENWMDIACTIEKYINDPKLCQKMRVKAYDYSLAYSWRKTSQDTFEFLEEVLMKYNKNN